MKPNARGPLFGLTLFLLSVGSGASAQTLTTLYSFSGSDGANPYAGLIADASGALYGTTFYGGAGYVSVSSRGVGTVFKLTPPQPAGGLWSD